MCEGLTFPVVEKGNTGDVLMWGFRFGDFFRSLGELGVRDGDVLNVGLGHFDPARVWIYLVILPVGPVLLDREGCVVDFAVWGSSRREAEGAVSELRRGVLPAVLVELLERLDSSLGLAGRLLVVEDEEVAEAIRSHPGLRNFNVIVSKGSVVMETFRRNAAKLMELFKLGVELSSG